MRRKLTMEELQRLSPGQVRESARLPLALVLDNIRSAYNVGAIFRTADAFGLEAMWLCGITARPPHREIHKTALGATETVPWKGAERVEDAVAELKRQGYRVALLEQATGSVSLEQFRPEAGEKYALVLGNEVSGVSESVLNQADVCLEIPQFGAKHSLNVAVSAGVAAWHFLLKMR